MSYLGCYCDGQKWIHDFKCDKCGKKISDDKDEIFYGEFGRNVRKSTDDELLIAKLDLCHECLDEICVKEK
jgi:hypothetical protein